MSSCLRLPARHLLAVPLSPGRSGILEPWDRVTGIQRFEFEPVIDRAPATVAKKSLLITCRSRRNFLNPNWRVMPFMHLEQARRIAAEH
ncbi:hypothetical protein DMB37_11520 [Nocardia sp. CS682]|nr:hypothetical protein DMB37_11520 [Nocardia sp. CS682]